MNILNNPSTRFSRFVYPQFERDLIDVFTVLILYELTFFIQIEVMAHVADGNRIFYVWFFGRGPKRRRLLSVIFSSHAT